MNEQLQGKLVEILASIQDAARATGDFAMRELPDVAQSYVMYGRVVLLLYVLAGVCFVIAAAVLMGKAFKLGEKFETEGRAVLSGAISVVFGVFGIGLILANVGQAALVWLAPKVWLLKEIAALIK